MDELKVSVPGRICLFGEHQDYLNLPVITAAINLRIAVSGKPQAGNTIHIDLPDIKSQESFTLPDIGDELTYVKERDYFRSVFNVIKRQGIHLETGYHCRVEGNIPINSGTSSSSALNIAWATFLVQSAAKNVADFPPEKIAYLAYLAEVEEFGEPGGMMDHYSTAIGGSLFLEFGEKVSVTKLKSPAGSFVLGDSMQAKDTKRILRHVKQGVLDSVKIIRGKDDSFDLAKCSRSDIGEFRPLLTNDQQSVLEGAIINREITDEANALFKSEHFDDQKFGQLLNTHHNILDNKLNISTDKINLMLKSAMDAGAYGGKINGSGGGGCMFVYAPENTQKVKEAIEKAGSKAYIVSIDEGIKIE
jgi:galactokinase